MASRKKPSPASKATKSASEDPAAELRRLREELRQQASNRDDEGGEDDDEDECALATFDPRVFGLYVLATHSAVPSETLTALTQGDRHMKEVVAATSLANSRHQENLFTGFAANSQLASGQLADAYAYGNAQRDRADRLQQVVAEKDLEIANRIRASEEAQLQRLQLQAENDRGQQALERLQLELAAKSRDKKAELDTVKAASAPVFQAVAGVVPMLLAQYAGKLGSLPPPAATAPPRGASGPASGGGSAGGPPEAEVSVTGAVEWQRTVVELLQDLKTPKVAACLRAMLCSYALGQYGAPPLPSAVTKEYLFDTLVEELGQDRVTTLLMSCREAYVAASSEPQSAAAAPN